MITIGKNGETYVVIHLFSKFGNWFVETNPFRICLGKLFYIRIGHSK